MTGMRVSIHRIDADAADDVYGSAYRRLPRSDGGAGRRRWLEILDFLPPERLRTHVAINAGAWPSGSEYLDAMADSPAVSALLDALPADGWIDRREDWEAAQSEEQARERDGGPTMLKWRRPIVRIGVHVAIEADDVIATDAADKMMGEFGEILTLRRDTQMFVFVARGCPQDIEERVLRAFDRKNG